MVEAVLHDQVQALLARPAWKIFRVPEKLDMQHHPLFPRRCSHVLRNLLAAAQGATQPDRNPWLWKHCESLTLNLEMGSTNIAVPTWYSLTLNPKLGR